MSRIPIYTRPLTCRRLRLPPPTGRLQRWKWKNC